MTTDTRTTALYFLRKLAYLLYLEVGALQPHIHPELAKKARLATAFFQREKERQSAELYRQSEHFHTPAEILAPYEERTGLSLDDVLRAFAEGDWRNKFGAYNFGGPKWVRIAELAVQLRDHIAREDWEAAEMVMFEIKTLKTNEGYLVSLFDRTERRPRSRRH